MNAEIFAEWLRRQGRKVYRTESSYWFDAGPGVLQAFPYHWLISPSQSEINKLLLVHGLVALRYSTPFGYPKAMVSYHIHLHQPYELAMLKPQARNGVRIGMKYFKIERISFERLATEGWALQNDTLERQGRQHSMSKDEWEQLCRAAEDLPGFEAWSAILDGNLAAALIVCRIDNQYYVPYSLCKTKSMHLHPNNILFFTVSSELLRREGVGNVFFTVQSLDAPCHVDEFKIRMGLLPKAVCQRVDFSPIVTPLATRGVFFAMNKLFKHYPSNKILAKALGMLHFHLEGKRPIHEQVWPKCIARQKNELLLPMEGSCTD